MPRYLLQVSYSEEAVAGMVKNPEDRSAAVRAGVESAGGKLESLYFAFGPDDAIAIVELPDNVTAAALSMAVTATGRYSSFQTTPLLTSDELTQAMRKAGTISFRAAGG
jgi:uncharacterized protein with GYD domain